MLEAIQEQTYRTAVLCVDFFKALNPWATLGAAVLLYVIFMRSWDFRKYVSLLIAWLLLLIAYVRLDAYFATAPFSPEGVEMAHMLNRVISGIVAAVIFLYHVVIAQ
ncbi:MAG: hypothetical protein ACM3L6_07710 [Deltaproteobacteria bacterium]